MIIRKNLPKQCYTKLDNKVFILPGLTDAAKVLYGYLASLRTGQDYSDKFLINAMGIGQATLTRRKRELKKVGLIMAEKTSMRTSVLYIGSTQMPANVVKELWDKIDSGEM